MTIKVCVRIPAERKDELLTIAASWRDEDKAPGWDAKAIHIIAKNYYGGLQEMFERHGWVERGSNMTPQVQRRVAERYGDVETFIAQHKKKVV